MDAERIRTLLDGRIPVVIVVEDGLGGVTAWSRRLKETFRDHPKYNLLMAECPVYSKEISGTRDLCCPTREDLRDALAALRPAIVVPNYAWEGFDTCAELLREGHDLRTIGFCRTDEDLYYEPLAWYEPIIARFAAVSPECVEKLAARIPARKDAIHLMPTGVWVPEPLERTYETAPIRLVYGGRMSQVQKRVLDFVPLVEHLLAMRVDFTLDLVGSGSQTEVLREAIERLPHGGRVRMHEAQPPEAMPDLWRAHDVALLVSEYEGTSNSMLESMAQGTVPLVTEASSGIRGIITEGENGFIVPIGAMGAMARCIGQLAQDPELLARAGAAARETARGYSMERYAERFEAMLDAALAEPRRTWTRTEAMPPQTAKLLRPLQRRPGCEDSPTPRAVPMNPPAPRSEPIVLVAAADDNFAMPLAVMVRSVLDTLAPDRRLKLYVLDGGITPQSKARLEASWRDERLEIEWCTPDLTPLRQLHISGHINAVAYCRLLIPSLLPDTVDKAIYLDGDLVVERDLGEMWDLDIAPYHLLAVQDMTLPYVDSQTALANWAQCGSYLTAPASIRHYEKRGISPKSKYLNSGVLMLNLARWRADGTAQAILTYLRDCKEDVIWHDQDGLNVILHDKWADMDERWNQIPHIHRYPSYLQSPYPEPVFDRILADPWIIHFSTRGKPWHADSTHPAQERFFHYLERTEWKGQRPERPRNLIANGGFAEWDGAKPVGWALAGDALVRPLEIAGAVSALELRVGKPGTNAQLAQRLRPQGDVARQQLVVTLKAKCSEKNALGLNAYVRVDGVQQGHSRNHPGDGRWHVLRHEIPLPIGTDPAALRVMIVLRGHAARPAEIADAFAAVVPRAGRPFRHTPLTRALALLPDPVRRYLRATAKQLKKRMK
jgi:lipopolysaccharide biosynthesis glycosyltransferase/glycosyltransferase involved in cell wall biosynthesis